MSFFPHPSLVIRGPVKSSPILVNAHNGSLNLGAVKGAKICFANLAFLFLHSSQFFSAFRIGSLALTSKNRTGSFANN